MAGNKVRSSQSAQKKQKFSCSSCERQITLAKDARRHPALETLICSPCHLTYSLVDDLSKYRGGIDLEGGDNYCRWCLDGGELVLCNDDSCRNGFCQNCIERNFGGQVLRKTMQSNSWYCYICDESQLRNLRELADKFLKSPTFKVSSPPRVRKLVLRTNGSVIKVKSKTPPPSGVRILPSPSPLIRKSLAPPVTIGSSNRARSLEKTYPSPTAKISPPSEEQITPTVTGSNDIQVKTPQKIPPLTNSKILLTQTPAATPTKKSITPSVTDNNDIQVKTLQKIPLQATTITLPIATPVMKSITQFVTDNCNLQKKLHEGTPPPSILKILPAQTPTAIPARKSITLFIKDSNGIQVKTPQKITPPTTTKFLPTPTPARKSITPSVTIGSNVQAISLEKTPPPPTPKISSPSLAESSLTPSIADSCNIQKKSVPPTSQSSILIRSTYQKSVLDKTEKTSEMSHFAIFSSSNIFQLPRKPAPPQAPQPRSPTPEPAGKDLSIQDLQAELYLSDDSSDGEDEVPKNVDWALKNGVTIQKRLKLYADSVLHSHESFNAKRFKSDPDSYKSWLQNIEFLLRTGSSIVKRCAHAKDILKP